MISKGVKEKWKITKVRKCKQKRENREKSRDMKEGKRMGGDLKERNLRRQRQEIHLLYGGIKEIVERVV